LPFSVLVSAPPTGDDGDPAALRATRWFGEDVGLIHIPSLQSLAALRGAPRPARQGAGFIGFGDPVLSGQATSRGFGTDRSSTANVRVLRGLARLPGTAAELERMGAALGTGPDGLFLGSRATETQARSADLSSARILAFATHGLVAGEAAGVIEAGLVMTPPATASAEDDGYLAASEVAGLRLDADWVILSACNTATSDRGSPGLGSLARAFLHAGARNLLASHWPVSDAVAPVLTVRTLELERAGLDRAEAFRRAMREIRLDASHDTDRTSWAHPFYWAPFVLIGDGGAGEASR
jgi:CHAT domain-containing protein